MTTARSAEAQRFLREMHAELQSNAEATGLTLAFSATERQTLGDVADHIDRKVELAKLYDDAEDVRVKVALATELRLIEASITRMLRTVDMCAPAAEDDAEDEAMTPTQRKARAAAQSRWKRERMRKRAALQSRSGGA
jgi:hypothetical protein